MGHKHVESLFWINNRKRGKQVKICWGYLIIWDSKQFIVKHIPFLQTYTLLYSEQSKEPYNSLVRLSPDQIYDQI